MLVMSRPLELLRDAYRFSKDYAQHEGAVNLIRAMPRKVAGLRGVGEIPRIAEPAGRPSRPISFIVTWCTDELRYNLLASTCVGDPANQLVVVDNRDHLAYRVRAAAINAGVRAAIHDLLVIVHEDVYLPDGWHQRLEVRLADLERFDPAWAVLGVAGWDESGKIVGHSRHLNVSLDSFRSGPPWIRASGLDDHLVIVRRCDGFSADESSPGHRGHATDLVQSANRASRWSYVLDVPTVHRWRDPTGRPIRTALDSPKAQNLFYSAYRAERAMGQEFLDLKWPARLGGDWTSSRGRHGGIATRRGLGSPSGSKDGSIPRSSCLPGAAEVRDCFPWSRGTAEFSWGMTSMARETVSSWPYQSTSLCSVSTGADALGSMGSVSRSSVPRPLGCSHEHDPPTTVPGGSRSPNRSCSYPRWAWPSPMHAMSSRSGTLWPHASADHTSRPSWTTRSAV